jgi:hypothetical protein
MAGPHADDAFIVSMVALTCIIAAIADWPAVVATVVLQLGGFAIVQFHQESARTGSPPRWWRRSACRWPVA